MSLSPADAGAIQPASPTVMRTAIQGEPGSNSHMAALSMLGPLDASQLLPCSSSAELFAALGSGAAAQAVLPIENSLHGSVFEHYDLLLEHGALILAEGLLRVQHHVIAAPGVTLQHLQQISSHPVALSQCRRWLRAHPQLAVTPAYDTAGSVKQLMASGARTAAGIAPALAAELYGAEILVRNIEDHAENYTRFYLLRAAPEPGATAIPVGPQPANKLTVSFTLQHSPGALLRALAAFAEHQVNLTRIESRPVPGRPWEYIFFADGRFSTPSQGEAALHTLHQTCEQVTLLGLYRAAE